MNLYVFLTKKGFSLAISIRENSQAEYMPVVNCDHCGGQITDGSGNYLFMVETDKGHNASPVYFAHLGTCTETVRREKSGSLLPMENSLRLFPILLGESLGIKLPMPDYSGDDDLSNR